MGKEKILLTVFYNTNTAVVNPTVYLKFLLPFLLLGGKFSWVVGLAYIVALYIYNIVYIVNDYIDYARDMAEKRQKKSFAHLYGENFTQPALWTALVVGTGAVLLGWQTVLSLALVALILGVVHSKVRGLKPVTFLLLRLFRITMPALLLLPYEPVFRNLLMLSLAVFPLYNLKSYIEYAELKRFNPKPGIFASVVLSGVAIYLFKQNVELLLKYSALFLILLGAVKAVSRVLTPVALSLLGETLKGMGYEDVEKKVEELLTLVIYLLLLGAVVWF